MPKGTVVTGVRPLSAQQLSRIVIPKGSLNSSGLLSGVHLKQGAFGLKPGTTQSLTIGGQQVQLSVPQQSQTSNRSFLLVFVAQFLDHHPLPY